MAPFLEPLQVKLVEDFMVTVRAAAGWVMVGVNVVVHEFLSVSVNV